MYLKRLEIQGFKSFAKKSTLEFEQGITAIVGPNGSGKSNVADSLRWVLGEQSAKLMRGKKSDDVIFAGSDKKTKLGFAEVFATFDNRDHKIPVDSAEVSIGRRVDRSGESEYLLNNNKVRLLDIIDLVLKSNIGTSRYTVIGQGTIDQMILAGPTEIKNLLDEASGVKTYYIKRDKTLRRLEQTAQNLMRAEDVVTELEPRLKSLRRQAKRMEARSEIEQELKILQQEWYSFHYFQSKFSLDNLNSEIEKLVIKKQELEKIILDHRTKVEKREGASNEDLVKYQEIQNKLSSLQDKKNGLMQNLSMIRGKMDSQKTVGSGDATSLQSALHTLNRKIEELEQELKDQETQVKTAKQDQTTSAESLRQINIKLDQLYSLLSSPVTGDLQGVGQALVELEGLFEKFHQSVINAERVEQVVAMSLEFKKHFTVFKHLAEKSLAGPKLSHIGLQEQLQELLKQRENLSVKLNAAEILVSKSALSKEFLDRQLQDLKQQQLQASLDFKKASSTDDDSFWKSLVSEEDKIKVEVTEVTKDIESLQESLKQYYQDEADWKQSISQEERALRVQQDELSSIREQESKLRVDQARVDTQFQTLLSEMHNQLGSNSIETLTYDKDKKLDLGLNDKIDKLKRQLELVGGVDELTLQEYQETESRYTNLTNQISDLKQGLSDLREIIDELDEHIKTSFNEAFHLVNAKFEHYFRILFNGGRAYLSIIKNNGAQSEEDQTVDTDTDIEIKDDLRPEEKIIAKYEKGSSNVSGVDIKATPPGKKLTSIQALSGGERALTSIALLCSLLTCFPSPFVVLDEVDAALDEANTIRFGQILASLAHQTQFITITHNRETMAQSNILYGVTMGDDGVSKLLSIKLDQAKVFAK